MWKGSTLKTRFWIVIGILCVSVWLYRERWPRWVNTRRCATPRNVGNSSTPHQWAHLDQFWVPKYLFQTTSSPRCDVLTIFTQSHASPLTAGVPGTYLRNLIHIWDVHPQEKTPLLQFNRSHWLGWSQGWPWASKWRKRESGQNFLKPRCVFFLASLFRYRNAFHELCGAKYVFIMPCF